MRKDSRQAPIRQRLAFVREESAQDMPTHRGLLLIEVLIPDRPRCLLQVSELARVPRRPPWASQVGMWPLSPHRTSFPCGEPLIGPSLYKGCASGCCEPGATCLADQEELSDSTDGPLPPPPPRDHLFFGVGKMLNEIPHF